MPSEKSLEANEIALRFRTRELNGVLMYIGNATKYLVVELFAGKLVIGSQLDSGNFYSIVDFIAWYMSLIFLALIRLSIENVTKTTSVYM